MKYTGRRQSDFYGQGQPTSPAAVSSSSNFASATISPSVSAAFTLGFGRTGVSDNHSVN